MARIATDGWEGGSLEHNGVGYGLPFSDSQYPESEPLQSNLCFTFSTGRWATGAIYSTTLHSAYNEDDINNPKCRFFDITGEYTRQKDQFDSIPINHGGATPGALVPYITSVTASEGSILNPSHLIRGDGRLNQGSFNNQTTNGDWKEGSYYSGARPATNWKYNNFAMYPQILGVYSGVPGADGGVTVERQPYIDTSVNISLFDFFERGFRPAETKSDGSTLLGYVYLYDIYEKGGSSPVNFKLAFAQEVSINIKAATVEYKPMTGSNPANKFGTVFDSYGFCSKRVLLGPCGCKTLSSVQDKNQYVQYGSTTWIGPSSIEGIQIEKSATAYAGKSSGKFFFYRYFPVIDPECMQHFIMTDFVKIAAQIGIPIITSSGALGLFKNKTNIAELGEGEVFFPKKKGNRIDLEELITGEQNIKETKEYKDAEENKGVMDETPEYDRGDTDTNNYTGKVPLNTPSFTTIGVFNRYFALSYTDLIDLADFLYTDDENEIAKIVAGLKLNGENPMNFMIGLRMFPFNILKYMTNTTTEEISFGNGVHTGVRGEKLNEEDSFTIELGHCKFPKYFKNFLDYEPYTTAKLYIPYCGEVDIPTSVFVGHEINVRLIVDITTGACVGAVSLDRGDDEKYVMFVPGMCSVEIPMTGTNATEYVSRGYDALNKMFSGAGQALMGVGAIGSSSKAITTSKNYNMLSAGQHSKSMGTTETSRSGTSLPGVAGGFASMLEGGYEFHNMPTPIQTQGSSTPMTSFYKPQQCYFMISRPVLLNVDIGNELGYACMVKKTISSLAAGTMFIAQNPKVQPKNATYNETAELNSLLASGVWK